MLSKETTAYQAKSQQVKLHIAQQIEQQIMQIVAHYSLDTQLAARFATHLFSDDFQPLAYYLNEIKLTLQQLTSTEDITDCQLISERLIAQVTALKEALQRQEQQTASSRKNKQNIHRLPARERLSKYYEALRALKEKQDNFLLSLHTAKNEQEASYYQAQIDHTEQRKARCLCAIEELEEYLSHL